MFPFDGSLTRHTASLCRVRSSLVPRLRRYYRRATTPFGSSRRTCFIVRRFRGCIRSSLPSPRNAHGAGQELVTRSPPGMVHGSRRASHVPGCPHADLPRSTTPAGSIGQVRCDRCDVAPTRSTMKAPATITISRLHHAASRLAVYASQSGLPQDHARLTSGC